ncbi:MAG: hypothetical protein AAGC76_09490 [Luteibacter sp.]|uniref:hypothetical protein n=1 Tax=Luteibacter sp. TaxID=1886636 RepID=UPI002809AA10|nr:hypothetical protein [Luteibacter sp.]MDQ7996073.1 hypothetical protein [Luteibacter sp.]
MSGNMAFFWRDIQTVRGAVRAALALPHVDIAELRQVQASHAYTVAPEPPVADMEKAYGAIHANKRRMTIQMAREQRTKAWQANPPSLADLFALPILAQVSV